MFYLENIPCTEPLLRQLGQDVGHLVEIGVQGLLFSYHFFERHALDARTLIPTITPVSPSASASAPPAIKLMSAT